jgi:DNA-binding MarR family transcriptional regulator
MHHSPVRIVPRDASGRGAPEAQLDRLALCRELIQDGEIIDRNMVERFHINPNFAMLLAIYEGEAEGREMYMFEVAQAATAPSSSAHRKLCEMVRLGMLTRGRTKVDHRRVCIHLAPETRAQIDDLLDRLLVRRVSS